MPLNPNGKIDKPALPFPDTAQASYTAPAPSASGLSPTEITMQSIWASILPNAPQPIPADESFFDLGGHSILATRLIFEIRKVFVVEAPLGLIFEQPTIAGLVEAVDALRNGDLGFAYKNPAATSVAGAGPADTKKAAVEYGEDYLALLDKLQASYPALPAGFDAGPVTVFLTGATGFLGAFVLHDLLSRVERVKKVICLVRGETVEQGLARLKEGSTDRCVWADEWITSGRLEVVTGDLGLDNFGLDDAVWTRVADETDVVLHNGALVSQPLVPTQYQQLTADCEPGPLGFPLREIAVAQCSGDAHCDQSRVDGQAKAFCVRVIDFGDRHRSLRATLRIARTCRVDEQRCPRKRRP